MRKGTFYPKGVTRTTDGIQFVLKADRPDTQIEISLCKGARELQRVTVPPDYRCGQLYSVVLECPAEADSYRYYQDGRFLVDFYARRVTGLERYGQKKTDVRYFLPGREYDWEDDRRPLLPYSEMILYGIHVRGFTKHVSSGVSNRGTYEGLVQKISYLKELGINAVELMPCYEFDEVQTREEPYQDDGKKKVNYWGFQSGYYYAPKSAYAASKDPTVSFCDMVKQLHRNGIEVIMQFYFPEMSGQSEIAEILRFWVENYHIDGFHLIGAGLPLPAIATDPFLRDTKLIMAQLPPADRSHHKGERVWSKNLAYFSEGFTYDMRKFLKGDDDCLNRALQHFRDNREDAAVINALTCYNGFTLNDLVSYERKHNEANGEENRDGSEYNLSWNCGAEGPSRKKQVLALREKQMRNGLAFVFLSQGVPYLQSGDEFAQTQNGNNNPYCQDNETTWLNWKRMAKYQAFHEYVKKLIAFRKAHRVFHKEEPLRIMDYIGCGYPDVSYHGEEAWRPVLENYSRHVAVMYCGKYACDRKQNPDAFFYVAYNMHWEAHSFALPRLPKGMKWQCCMDTADPEGFVGIPVESDKAKKNQTVQVEARSVKIFQSIG